VSSIDKQNIICLDIVHERQSDIKSSAEKSSRIADRVPGSENP
jgi:hypothetical protein